MRSQGLEIGLGAREHIAAFMKNYYAVNPYDTTRLHGELVNYIRQFRELGYWSALIDGAFDHGQRSSSLPIPTYPIYYKDKLAYIRPVSPLLLELPLANEDELETALFSILNHCRGRPMLSFVCSSQPPQHLAESWQEILEIQTDDGQPFLLRFADTRVTPAIALALSGDVWPRLSRDVRQWLCIDRYGELQPLTTDERPAPAEDPAYPICIDQTALSWLLKLGEPDALANELYEHFPELLLRDRGAKLYEELAKTGALGEKHGVEAFPDLVALAVSVRISDGSLLYDPAFENWLQRREWLTVGMADALAEYLETSEAGGI